MNESNDPIPPDDLDRLLRAWATGREASADHLSSLQRQIVERLAEQPLLEVAPESQSSSSGDGRPRGGGWTRGRRPAWFLAAAAASLLLIVGARVWLGGDRSRELPPGRTTELVENSVPKSPAGSESFPKEELAAKARLFAEMQAVFGDQLQWLAETTGHIDLGLAKRATAADRTATGNAASTDPAGSNPAADDHRPLMVQVVVERRAAGAGQWKIVWATEVVALNQESVTVPVADGAVPAALSLWAYRLPDGMVFVESDVTLSGAHSTVQSTSTNILEDNRPTEVGSVDVDGAEYRIFQTVAALNGDLG